MAKEEKKRKIVIFNLSGALLLPFDKKITLWCDAIRTCSAPLVESLIYQNYQKSFHKEIIPLLAAAGNWTQQQQNEVIVTARGSFDNDNFVSLAGLAENMRALKEFYDLGVVTNRFNRELEESLLSLGLEKSCFRIIHTADEGVYKPDPRVFKNVLKDYRRGDVLYIGTAKNDLLAAEKAGIKFWGLTSSTCPQGLFWAYGLTSEQTFPSITEALKKLLEE
jgi:FMN phosphatase YigB (HAD superfamily)